MDESQWVTQMTNILKKQAKNDLDNPTCIFQVPSSMHGTKQEFYTPQLMALGPYHHLRTKPYQMQKCKLDFALKAQDDLQLTDFDELFKAIKEKVVAIRGRYDGQNISMSDDTLSCVMAIDGLFLLQLICNQGRIFPTQPSSGRVENTFEDEIKIIKEAPYGKKMVQEIEEDASKDNYNIEKKIVPTRIETVIIDIEGNHNIVDEQNAVEYNHKGSPPKFIDAAGREYSAEEILRDMVKLENQVPTIVLNALRINSSCRLMCNLVNLGLKLSPIVLEGNWAPSQVLKNFHLLDTLYILAWFGLKQVDGHLKKVTRSKMRIKMNLPSSAESWSGFWSYFKNLQVGFIGIFAAVVDFFLNALKVLGISISLDFSEDEFLIPSASKLKRVGVNFSPIGPGGIKDINFYKTTLKLPVLKYDAKLTEVVIRNLLAYEALAIPETPKFASFIELMSSLITSDEDVEVLKADNALPSDVNVIELVKLLKELVSSDSSKDSSNDQPDKIKQAIEGVNEYYNNTRKVRIQKCIKKYLSVSWKVLTVLAVVLLLLLMALQTFCSIYKCPKLFHTN